MTSSTVDNLKNLKQFPPLVEGDCNPEEFLDASQRFIEVFDSFGPPAFSVVKNDFQDDIKTVRLAAEKETAKGNKAAQTATATPLTSNSVSDKKQPTGLKRLVSKENKFMANKPLLSLLRGLSFICGALDEVLNNKRDTYTAFATSYKQTLQKHHNMIETSLYTTAIEASRKLDLAATLGANIAQNQLQARIDEIRKIVEAMSSEYGGDKLKPCVREGKSPRQPVAALGE